MPLTTPGRILTEVPAGRHPQVMIRNGIYKVVDLISFLEQTFGKPDITVKSDVNMNAFKNKKGIIVFNVGWSDATGHATLWNGTDSPDSCYFQQAGEAMLWELK